MRGCNASTTRTVIPVLSKLLGFSTAVSDPATAGGMRSEIFGGVSGFFPDGLSVFAGLLSIGVRE
jgi:hypothetical protein